jgi:uncharacterized Zn finger protein (UPF0148 family)
VTGHCCTDCRGPVFATQDGDRTVYVCRLCRLSMTDAEARAAGAAFEAVVRAETDRRIRAALDHIQRAQDELDRATNALSPITYIGPEWKAVGAARDRVHATWYRVRKTLDRPKATLDGDARERLAKEL